MAAGMFLNLQGPTGPVKGSSTDAQFPAQIEIEAFSFTGPSFSGDKVKRSVPGGQASFALTVAKLLDVSSPALLQLFSKHQSAQPQPFTSAVLSLRPSIGYVMLVWTLGDLYLLDYQFLPLYLDSNFPREKLSLSFRSCQLQYTAMNAITANPAAPVSMGWNLKTMQSM